MQRSCIFMAVILLALTIGCAASNKIAGGLILRKDLKDGVYDGKATEGPVKVVATVKIQNQSVTGIDIIHHRNWRGKPAEEVIPARIIKLQSTRVDAVSGATASSVAIMNAVEDAVRKAR